MRGRAGRGRPVTVKMREGTFAPREVFLRGSFPPLCGTMGKTEVEVAAAYLVFALAKGSGEWRALPWRDLCDVLGATVEAVKNGSADPLDVLVRDLSVNPFAQPDFFRLAEDGFAMWLGEPGGNTPLAFTDKGIEAMRRWVFPIEPEKPATPARRIALDCVMAWVREREKRGPARAGHPEREHVDGMTGLRTISGAGKVYASEAVDVIEKLVEGLLAGRAP